MVPITTVRFSSKQFSSVWNRSVQFEIQTIRSSYFKFSKQFSFHPKLNHAHPYTSLLIFSTISKIFFLEPCV